MVVGKEDGDTNLADFFTKILTGERGFSSSKAALHSILFY